MSEAAEAGAAVEQAPAAGDVRSRDPLSRALKVLNWMIDDGGTDWSLTQIATGAGMTPSTTHRILNMLVENDLVFPDEVRGRYRVGLGLLQLAWRTSAVHSVAGTAGQSLRQLAATAGETAWLALYDHRRREMMFVASAETEKPIRHVRRLNEWVPVSRGGAAGRVVVASLDEQDRRSLFAADPALAAVNWFPSPDDALRARARGYVLSSGQNSGVGVAAPIHDRRNRLFGVVGIGMPEQRFSRGDEARLSAAVCQCAAELRDDLLGPGGRV